MKMSGLNLYETLKNITHNTPDICKDGLLISAIPTSAKAVITYLILLVYCFLGIAIAANMFMCSIEVITSATREVRIKKTKKNQLVVEEAMSPDESVEKVRIWNPTVANLTLMALGSSAPEILLSCIEIVGNKFNAGDLGPGTIVGSAAFNLLCITAVCVFAIPSPKTKRIEQTAVFGITSIFSCFAYIWLLIMLVVVSPNVIELWEAALTLIFFVILVVVSYLGDIRFWQKKIPDFEMELKELNNDKGLPEMSINDDLDDFVQEYVLKCKINEEYGKPTTPDFVLIKELTRKVQKIYPELTLQQVAKLLALKLQKIQINENLMILILDNHYLPHTRLYYRIKGSKILTASHRKTETEMAVERMLNEAKQIEQVDKAEVIREETVEFSAKVYGIGKDQSNVQLKVIRHGPTNRPLTFHYCTVNGVAKKDLHFYEKSETARFAAHEDEKIITIELVEGADWRPNASFGVQLKLDARVADEEQKAKLGKTFVARICRPFDRQTFVGEPMVEFSDSNYVVRENEGYVRTFVRRRGYHDGCEFSITYDTNGISAKNNVDYVGIRNGVLKFGSNEYEKYIDVRIIDDEEEEKDETFEICITAVNGDITIGPNKRTVITIICDDNVLKNILNVHKLTSYYLTRMSFGAKSWVEQISAAVSVNEGDVVNATLLDCLLHAVAFPWKFTLAFIPPPKFLGGWPCFFVALFAIGLITAVTGDLASIFGCMIGLKDTVTAITFVALGTSLPDTFASRIAAQNVVLLMALISTAGIDDTADNAIGNVTGSNSVNVFLGLGLPWFIAAFYWYLKGEQFAVNAGSLGFSVAIFMITSILCLLLLLIRRYIAFFGKAELGGPMVPKVLSALFLTFLWLVYIIFSTLQAYGFINV